MTSTRELAISVADGSSSHRVSALYQRPRGARAVYLLAHGAGAGMRHAFLEAVSAALSEHKIATLRYQFPYMEARRDGHKPPPNRAPVLEATVRAAARVARRYARGIPLIAGGKSMGGRMTSRAAAEEPIAGVDGLVFLGFPLHPAGRVEKARERAAHLAQVSIPMLFVQGSRDALAELRRIRRVARSLGASATMHVVREADHSFAVRARSGRKPAEVLGEISAVIDAWVRDSL